MNKRLLESLLRLSGTLKCSCGANYRLLSIESSIKDLYLLKVIHSPDNKEYTAIILYNLKTNKLLTDGNNLHPSQIPDDIKQILGNKIKLLGIAR